MATSGRRLTELHDLGWFAPDGTLTPEHRAVWAVLAADGIIGGDGFATLLPDEDLDLPSLPAAARRVGAAAHAEVLDRFVALAAAVGDPDEPTDAEWAVLEELDAAWSALPSVDDPVGRFVAANAEAFPPPGTSDLTDPPDRLAACPELHDEAVLARVLGALEDDLRAARLPVDPSYVRSHVLTFVANAREPLDVDALVPRLAPGLRETVERLRR